MKIVERELNALFKINDIRNIFSCSLGKAYAIIHLPGFPKMQIGRQFYVVPDELDRRL